MVRNPTPGRTLVEIAADLDISNQAVSERLRRARTKVVGSAITADLAGHHTSDPGDPSE